MRRAIFVALLAAVGIAGCGGPSAAERAQTERDRQARADRVSQERADRESAKQIAEDCFRDMFVRYGVDLTGYGEKRIPDAVVPLALQGAQDCERAKAREAGIDVDLVAEMRDHIDADAVAADATSSDTNDTGYSNGY